jgi:hypothetical protein
MEFQERSQQENMTNARLQQYMAFCVTKADIEDIWDQGKESADLVKDVMGHSLFTSLETGFCLENRYSFYSVASIGRYFDNDSQSWKEAVLYPDIPDISNPSDAHTNLSSAPSPRRRYSQGKSHNSQASDASSGQPSTRTSPSLSSDDDYGLFNQASITPEPPTPNQPTINTKVQYEPFNIITPIEWLINSIQREPPSRPQPN